MAQTAAQRRLIRRWLHGNFYTGATQPQSQGQGGGGGGAPAAPAPVGPPPGSFDPGLEYQAEAADRGLSQLEQDTERADRLSERDLEIALNQAQRGAHRGMQDLRRSRNRGEMDIGLRLSRGLSDADLRRGDASTSFARDMADLATAEERGGEDHARALASLQRKYDTMAGQQGEAAASAGYTRGGFAQQSAEKRAGNQAFERAPIDTALQRQQADIGLRRGREGEDLARQMLGINTDVSRLQQDTGIDTTRLGEDFSRAKRRTRQDLTTQTTALQRQQARDARTRALELSRATLENSAYQTATTQQEFFQAHQSDPHIKFPGAPKRRRPH